LGGLLLGLTVLAVGVSMTEEPRRYHFEALGEPFHAKPVAMSVVTRAPDGRFMAWGVVEAPSRYGVIGVSTDNGKTVWLETTGYGQSHIRIHAAPNGALYLYAGVPGRFLKYDPQQRKLTDLGVPAKNASYWLGQAIGPDGKFCSPSPPPTPSTARAVRSCRTGARSCEGRRFEKPGFLWYTTPMATDTLPQRFPVSRYDVARNQVLGESTEYPTHLKDVEDEEQPL
jgi:hypothetical protein